jgi:hypothetical protein
MTNAFTIRRNSPLMAEIKKLDVNRKVSKGATRWVEAQRKSGIEPCADLNLNTNFNTRLLGKKKSNG